MTETGFRVAAQRFDEAIPVGAIREHPENYNEGDTGAISRSLDSHGFFGAVLVQQSTGLILVGNHRYREAVAKGALTLPGFMLDVSDDEAAEIMVADNWTTHQARFNEEKLLTLLTRARDSDRGLTGTAVSEDALTAMLRRRAAVTSGTEGDWEGMPEFDQPDGKPYYSIRVHVPDAESEARFWAALGIAERPRTTFIWWPHDDGRKGWDTSTMEVAAETPQGE